MKDSILIVDDEPNVIASLKRVMMEEPYETYSANSAEEGLKFLSRTPVKVIVSDEKMPGMTGAEFLSAVKEQMPETIRIMLTGQASLDAAMNAVNSGEIYRFFLKPWNEVELMLAIRSALDKFNLEDENRRLLRIVKRQALDLRLLERKYPSITKLEKDENGHLLLPDISATEFSEIVAQCEREFS
jgi:DNA-binding NtrC family response regulator